VAAILLACLRADPVGQTAQTASAPDRENVREYVLEATMLGYRGVGGEIDGVRNPTLWARTGQTVRITIVNGETMVHDVGLEKLGLKSLQILDKAATTNITFKATENDTYYGSVPGHRQAGYRTCVGTPACWYIAAGGSEVNHACMPLVFRVSDPRRGSGMLECHDAALAGFFYPHRSDHRRRSCT